MTRQEFKQVASDAIEQLTRMAETVAGQTFPRSYCFSWLGGDEIVAEGDVAEFLVHLAFVDDTHISPCFDLFLVALREDGRLHLRGYRAGYPPCAFGDHVTYRLQGHDAGRVGPFKLGMWHIVQQFSHETEAQPGDTANVLPGFGADVYRRF
jgi:hypothetical protein